MASAHPHARRRQGGISPLTIIIIFPLFIGGIVFLPTTVLILTGMLPTIVSILIDRDPQRYTSMTVGLMNTAGVIPLLIKLWVMDESMETSLHLLSDPVSWLMMYGAATFGWLIFFTVPPIVQTLINQHLKLRISGLEHKQQAMVKEWGEDIKSGVQLPNPVNPV